MCLIIDPTKYKIKRVFLFKIFYKVLLPTSSKDYITPFRFCKVKRFKLYKSEIDKPEKPINLPRVEHLEINKGIHLCKDKLTATILRKRYSTNIIIVLAIVPPFAKIIYGEFNELVTNKVMYI